MTACLSVGGVTSFDLDVTPPRALLVGTVDGVVALERASAGGPWRVAAKTLAGKHVSALAGMPKRAGARGHARRRPVPEPGRRADLGGFDERLLAPAGLLARDRQGVGGGRALRRDRAGLALPERRRRGPMAGAAGDRARPGRRDVDVPAASARGAHEGADRRSGAAGDALRGDRAGSAAEERRRGRELGPDRGVRAQGRPGLSRRAPPPPGAVGPRGFCSSRRGTASRAAPTAGGPGSRARGPEAAHRLPRRHGCFTAGRSDAVRRRGQGQPGGLVPDRRRGGDPLPQP